MKLSQTQQVSCWKNTIAHVVKHFNGLFWPEKGNKRARVRAIFRKFTSRNAGDGLKKRIKVHMP